MKNKELILDLIKIGVVKFGRFKLKSGKISPIYIDLRILVSYPSVLKRVAHLYLNILKELKFDRLVAIPYTALPITGAISLEGNLPWIYSRKEIKKYGTKRLIEGEYRRGERAVLVDDLITTGLSKFESIKILEKEGLKVSDIVVLIDRGEGGKEELKKRGYNLHSVFTLKEILDILEQTKVVSKKKIDETRVYLKLDKDKR